MTLFCHIVLCLEILDQIRPVCWSIVVKEEPNICSPCFGVFPSDRIPTVTKDVNVSFFIHSSNFCKSQKGIPGTS
jgi:hypothetical protein